MWWIRSKLVILHPKMPSVIGKCREEKLQNSGTDTITVTPSGKCLLTTDTAVLGWIHGKSRLEVNLKRIDPCGIFRPSFTFLPIRDFPLFLHAPAKNITCMKQFKWKKKKRLKWKGVEMKTEMKNGRFRWVPFDWCNFFLHDHCFALSRASVMSPVNRKVMIFLNL